MQRAEETSHSLFSLKDQAECSWRAHNSEEVIRTCDYDYRINVVGLTLKRCEAVWQLSSPAMSKILCIFRCLIRILYFNSCNAHKLSSANCRSDQQSRHTSGVGSEGLSISCSLDVSNISPNASFMYLAILRCCVSEQWFSSERIRG